MVVLRRPRREGVFHPSGVVALSGVRALGVRPKAPGSSPRLAGSRVQLSRQAHPRSTTLAPAPLNIATALHAEAIGAVSHGFAGRRVQNAKILHFVEFAEEMEGVATPYPWKVFGQSPPVWADADAAFLVSLVLPLVVLVRTPGPVGAVGKPKHQGHQESTKDTKFASTA